MNAVPYFYGGTGDPIPAAPRAVVVQAATHMEASALALLGRLRGPEAESFLSGEAAKTTVIR